MICQVDLATDLRRTASVFDGSSQDSSDHGGESARHVHVGRSRNIRSLRYLEEKREALIQIQSCYGNNQASVADPVRIA